MTEAARRNKRVNTIRLNTQLFISVSLLDQELPYGAYPSNQHETASKEQEEE